MRVTKSTKNRLREIAARDRCTVSEALDKAVASYAQPPAPERDGHGSPVLDDTIPSQGFSQPPYTTEGPRS